MATFTNSGHLENTTQFETKVGFSRDLSNFHDAAANELANSQSNPAAANNDRSKATDKLVGQGVLPSLGLTDSGADKGSKPSATTGPESSGLKQDRSSEQTGPQVTGSDGKSTKSDKASDTPGPAVKSQEVPPGSTSDNGRSPGNGDSKSSPVPADKSDNRSDATPQPETTPPPQSDTKGDATPQPGGTSLSQPGNTPPSQPGNRSDAVPPPGGPTANPAPKTFDNAV